MISASDFIRLPYTPDLTEAGIAYACRSLLNTYNRMGGSSFERLRRIVGGVAVELAFRRYLSEACVPFDVKGATPFTDPDRYDVLLGGHRCDLKSFLLTRRGQIRGVLRDLKPLLEAPALVPSDQFAAQGHSDQDLYLFSFLCGLVTPSRVDLQKALQARQPSYLIYPLPREWVRPRLWQGLAPIALKSDCERALTVELGGQNPEREFISQTVELPPRRRLEVHADFHALAYLHVVEQPDGRLGLFSPLHNETHLISPHQWGNIWVYGMQIVLTGYLSRQEFRRRAHQVPPGSRVFQYTRTRTKNLSVPVGELKPLADLFERVRHWEAGKSQ
jgi:hypothetical protein